MCVRVCVCTSVCVCLCIYFIFELSPWQATNILSDVQNDVVLSLLSLCRATATATTSTQSPSHTHTHSCTHSHTCTSQRRHPTRLTFSVAPPALSEHDKGPVSWPRDMAVVTFRLSGSPPTLLPSLSLSLSLTFPLFPFLSLLVNLWLSLTWRCAIFECCVKSTKLFCLIEQKILELLPLPATCHCFRLPFLYLSFFRDISLFIILSLFIMV